MTYTIKDDKGNVVLSIESSDPIKSEEDFYYNEFTGKRFKSIDEFVNSNGFKNAIPKAKKWLAENSDKYEIPTIDEAKNGKSSFMTKMKGISSKAEQNDRGYYFEKEGLVFFVSDYDNIMINTGTNTSYGQRALQCSLMLKNNKGKIVSKSFANFKLYNR